VHIILVVPFVKIHHGMLVLNVQKDTKFNLSMLIVLDTVFLMVKSTLQMFNVMICVMVYVVMITATTTIIIIITPIMEIPHAAKFIKMLFPVVLIMIVLVINT